MEDSKSLLKNYTFLLGISFTVFMAAEIAHYIFWGKFFVYLINSLILVLFIAYWAFLRNDYIQLRAFRHYRLALGAVMIFWFFCKCSRDRFFMENDTLVRYSWYAYYIAIILLPLICYELSLEFDRSSVKKTGICKLISRILAAVLIVLVMTNDVHRLAFSFPKGLAAWDASHNYKIVYYLIFVFGATCFILSIVHAFRRCILPKTKKYICLPILPLVVGFVYIILYFLNADLYINRIRFFSLADVFCWLTLIFAEGIDTVYRIGTESVNGEILLAHRIKTEIAKKLQKTDAILLNPSEKSDAQCKADFYRAGFIHTYCKRVANLMILAEQSGVLDFEEFSLSMAESVEYLKLNGVEAMLVSEGKRSCSLAEVLAVYSRFQDYVEPILDRLSAILIVIEANKKEIHMNISAEDEGGNPL